MGGINAREPGKEWENTDLEVVARDVKKNRGL